MIETLLAMVSVQMAEPKQLEIPPAFHGTWDAYPTACSYPVSDMRLAIDADEFSIYRDQFKIRSLTLKSEGSLTLMVAYRAHDDLDNEGFGEPYELVWKLSDTRNELTMTSSKGSTTWHRCPTEKEAS